MAELLIKANNNWMDSLSNQEIKDRGLQEKYNSRYVKGDIIEVRDDNSQYGNEECLPKFLVVKIEGSKEYLKYLGQPIVESVLSSTFEGCAETKKLIKKSRYNFNIDKLMKIEDIDEIAKSNWLVKEIDKNTIFDKKNKR